MKDLIYPCTIFRARYGGVYEGAEWIAVNESARCDLLDDMQGDDSTCSNVFYLLSKGKEKNYYGEKIFVGRGKNAQEAYEDLYKKYFAPKKNKKVMRKSGKELASARKDK